MSNSRIPQALHSMLLAMLVAIGAGGSAYLGESDKATPLTPYLQAAADDASTSDAVKVAMVLGSFFESSFRHIGTPYIDKLGKGQPLTVCNGITGVGVQAGRTYTESDCYALERGRYVQAEAQLVKSVTNWHQLTTLQRAVILDFVHNVGMGAFANSTMQRKLLAGDITGACRENERWTRGTVRGVSVVLPGLVVRANARADLCGGVGI